MKILFVADRAWPAASGSQLYLHAMAERLQRDGHAVEILATDALDLEYFWDPRARRAAVPREVHNGVGIQRVPVRHTPLPRLSFPALRYLNATLAALPFVPFALLHALARWTPPVPGLTPALAARRPPPARPDLVHAINLTLDGINLQAAELARAAGARLVLTPFLHTGHPRFYAMRHQLALLRQADAVIAQTRIERDYLLARGIPAGRIHIIGAGVDPDALAGGDGARFRHWQNIEGPLVAFVGIAAFDKGAQHLVAAARELWRAGENFTLVMAGATPPAFIQFIETLRPDERTRLRVLGSVSEANKRDLLAASHLLVLPSRTDSFGIVLLEAWLYNKPVIGARAGGLPGVVDEGRDGLLVEFGDIHGLAQGMARLLHDRPLSDAMGHAGHAKVLQEYTWDAQYDRLSALYRAL